MRTPCGNNLNILRLVIVALFLICWADLAAQDDPYGAVDTVYIDNVTASPGKEFSMDVNLWNDEELGAVTITLIYPTDKLEFIDFDKTGRLDYLSEIPTQHDPATGKLLVGAIVIFEDYIQPGRGKLFSMRFKVKDSVSPGEEITVDSVAYSTAASLSLTAFDAYTIVPAFLPGKVTVGAENRPPYFTPIPDVYIAEGDSLYINVEATDPDGDQLTLANRFTPTILSLPIMATAPACSPGGPIISARFPRMSARSRSFSMFRTARHRRFSGSGSTSSTSTGHRKSLPRSLLRVRLAISYRSRPRRLIPISKRSAGR
jgi:hypothetical protein